MNREEILENELGAIREILEETPPSFGLRPEIDRINKVLEPRAQLCPICDSPLREERCKLICTSPTCVHLVVANCNEL